MKMSKALIEKLKKDKSWNTIVNYINSKWFFKTLVMYAINWKYRTTRKDLHKWIIANCELPSKVKTELNALKNIKDKDSVMRQILMYVNKNIEYNPDETLWKVKEYWATPKETWMKLRGDCEDGAILTYAIANYVGIPDNQIFIVAGLVEGGGHCYVVYRSEQDGLEYPLDWCYWFKQSVKMDIPYIGRVQYFYGTKEWFRFNKSGGYKPINLVY